MARTWSVPQRRNFVDFVISELRHNRSLAEPGGGRGFARRGPLLFFAALLTAAGAIVPHLDSDSISTFLFVAGAGLAALVVMLPLRSQPVREDKNVRSLDFPAARNASNGGQARFAELLGGATSNAALDRAAWARLTAHMSHELRTPLNAVLGFSELMVNEVFGPLGPGYSAYARDIHASGRILLKSAEDALAITALLTAPERRRDREASRLKSMVDEACAFAAPDLAARSIAVAIDIDPSIRVTHDHQVIRQMLINLVAEAVRSAAAGAILRFDTKTRSDAVELTLSLAADGTDASTDQGFGMILARTLCELSGARLSSGRVYGERSWTVRLVLASQDDLFLAAA